MNIYLVCERTMGLIGGNPIREIDDSQRQMLEDLDYDGLVTSHAQEEAIVCVKHFKHVRDGLLQQYPFVFARKNQPLAQLGRSVSGWSYAYALPSDCLRPLQFIRHGIGVSKSLYELAGREVYAACDMLAVRYTSTAEDVSTWDNAFTNIFCYALAAEVAITVTGVPNMGQVMREQMQMSISEAYRVGAIDEVPGMTLDIDMFDAFNTYNLNKGSLGGDLA